MSSSTSHDLSKCAGPELQGPGINLDVLWCILQILSDPEEPDEETRFKAVHNIAQVCRAWRRFTLDSASIWASMVNLNALNKSSEQWREEFMRRTRSAPLSVYGTLDTWHTDPVLRPREVFFLSLFVELHRIRIFRVHIQESYFSPKTALDILWTSPAPILEEFHLRTNNAFSIYRPKIPGGRLFKDHAPRLRLFSWPQLAFSYNVRWAEQLTQRDVIVHADFDPHQALKIIQKFPRARTLTFNHVPRRDPREIASIPLLSLNLPHLSRIAIGGTPNACFAMLSHITPSSSCTLSADMYVDPLYEDPGNYDLEPVLLPYIRSAFLGGYLDAKKSLSMRFGPELILLNLKHDKTSLLSIRLPCDDSTEIPLRYLTILSSCPLGSIEKLHLATLPEHELALSCLRNLVSNLSSASLKELSITGRVLACLNMLSTEEIEPLSSLERIEFQPGVRELHFKELVECLVALLRRLQAVWQKTMVLDVARYYLYGSSLKFDWRALEEFQGLTVVFKRHFTGRVHRYICGTGHPEMLAHHEYL